MAKFCSSCGKELDEKASFCVNCGVMMENDDKLEIDTFNDKGGFLWGLFGANAPIAGLILFIIWRKKRPKTAKAVGIGSLVYVIFNALILMLTFVLAFKFGVNDSYDEFYDYYDDYYDYGYNHEFE